MESHTRTGGGSASINLTFPGQASRAQRLPSTHRRAPPDTQDQHRLAPRNSCGNMDLRQQRGPRRFPRTTRNGHTDSTRSTPSLRQLNPRAIIGQRDREDRLSRGTQSSTVRLSTPTQPQEEEGDRRGTPQRTRTHHYPFVLASPQGAPEPIHQCLLAERNSSGG
jgi:hypothetical protein